MRFAMTRSKRRRSTEMTGDPTDVADLDGWLGEAVAARGRANGLANEFDRGHGLDDEGNGSRVAAGHLEKILD